MQQSFRQSLSATHIAVLWRPMILRLMMALLLLGTKSMRDWAKKKEVVPSLAALTSYITINDSWLRIGTNTGCLVLPTVR